MSGIRDFLPSKGPHLVYLHSNGTAVTLVDLTPVQDNEGDDGEASREKRICRALLQHALDLLNGEDTF